MESTNFIDRPRAVRSGEELDAARLAAYLATVLPLAEGVAADLAVAQFPSGYSNLTYQIQYGQRDLVLRRPPVGANIRSGHDMQREFRVYSALADVFPAVPRPLAYCDDLAVLGAPFYLMERVQGVILRAPLPAGLTPAPDTMANIATSFVQQFAAIHTLDWSRDGLRDLGHPDGYVQRQISGWIDRYARAKTDDIPSLERTAVWLQAEQPATSQSALIHNDYKYDNLILDPTDLSHIIAVLDWEMATIGDPLMDLGTTLGYWADPDDPPAMLATTVSGTITTLPGNPDREALAHQYALASGRDVGNIVFYYVYGLFKIAVIAQQIYARYRKGLTQDERFGRLLAAIQTLGMLSERAISLRRISHLG